MENMKEKENVEYTWYDGTYDFTIEEFENEFPIKVTDDIRFSKDKTRVAIVNNFKEGSKEYELADPHANSKELVTFYHPFYDDEAVEIKKLFDFIISSGKYDEDSSFTLFRHDDEDLFSYSYGHICKSLINEQDKLSEHSKELGEHENIFLLPLQMYRYRCPVCGKRSLEYRGMFEICDECGWEDEGYDDPDEEGYGANGEITIRDYRNIYLMLKYHDPDYNWYKNGLARRNEALDKFFSEKEEESDD